MYRSGIALSAIAALLIPIDFYTVYVNFNVPANVWPLFWLLTSLTCLSAYLIGTFIIRHQFFGYLVGVAAGSTVLALVEIGHQSTGLSLDWRSAGLSALTLGLIILATYLAPPADAARSGPRASLLAAPFRYLSLLGVTIIMLLTLAWRYSRLDTFDTFHNALIVNWWIGSLIFGWGAVQYRSRGLGLMAVVAWPVAIFLAQTAIFHRLGIVPAWHAFGWALLALPFLVVGFRFLKPEGDPVTRAHGRTTITAAVVLIFVAMLWPLTDFGNGAAAASSHAVLAGAFIVAALMRQRPAYLYGTSALTLSAISFAQAELNLTLAQFSVGWAALAILLIITAVSAGTRFPAPIPNFAGPLVVSAYGIAALSVLVTIMPEEGDLLVYALANLLALTAWGARLAHVTQPGFVGRSFWGKTRFHWFTAGLLPVWLWALFANVRPFDTTVPLALAVLAWGMVSLSYRLSRVDPAYRWPWYIGGLLVYGTAILAAFTLGTDSLAAGLTLLAVGLLLFLDALSNRQSVELAPAGLLTAWGIVALLTRLQVPSEIVGFCLGILIAIYFLAGLWAEGRSTVVSRSRFCAPLYLTAHVLTAILLVRLYLPAVTRILVAEAWSDPARLWAAAGQILLALVYGLYAWRPRREKWAYFATFLAAAGGSFGLITFSTGTGSVTAELAWLAIAFVFAERALLTAGRRGGTSRRKRGFIRLTWRRYGAPLLRTGWLVSALVIGLALFYNLIILEGGQAERLWAAVALGLIGALYSLSARMFRRVRFAWLAAALAFLPWTILAGLGWFLSVRPTPALYVFSWSILAWVLYLIYLTLRRLDLPGYARAPRGVAHVVVLVGLMWTVFSFSSNSPAQALGLIAFGVLYLADAKTGRHRLELIPGALITGWGYLALLHQFDLSEGALVLATTLLITGYILAGLWVERGGSVVFNRRFLSPLYFSAQILTLGVLLQIYFRPLESLLGRSDWTDSMRWGGAAGQLVLAITYGLYAWGTYRARWGYFSTWLLALSGAFVAISLSTGSGSSAAKAALGATAFILLERWLFWLCTSRGRPGPRRAVYRSIWWLYRRPLLVTGWLISAAAIWLALVRNLWLLGGSQSQQVWAATALTLIAGLYALSAGLFRQARFLWLAAPLTFIPWTILTNLGWFTLYRPTTSGYAVSWAWLAWLLLGIGIGLDRRAPAAYTRPIKTVAQILMPVALLWGLGNIDTSRFTFGLAVGFYSLAAALDLRRATRAESAIAGLRQTKFLYPALALVPAWSMYLLAWLAPEAQRGSYGLLLLVIGLLGLLVGYQLGRRAPSRALAGSYALPGYVAGYACLFIGTVLVANDTLSLALALLYDAVLLLVSAWLFKRAGWVYLALILLPWSLLLTLQHFGVAPSRWGWWLIALAILYLVSSRLLRRTGLVAYSPAPLIIGFPLVAAALPPSSLDQVGALWGYASAAIIFAVSARWLRQPLLLWPATTLAVVPYAIGWQLSPLPYELYGLASFPGIILALGLGWLLDRRCGAWGGFPWGDAGRWFTAVAGRLLGWWALPLYMVGFSAALVSPLFSGSASSLLALDFLLMAAVFSWAVSRFRLRGWLALALIAGQLVVVFYLAALDNWRQPDLAQAWLRFLPVTLIIGLVTLVIARVRQEKSPFSDSNQFKGWSHVVYIMLVYDLVIGQSLSLLYSGSGVAVVITFCHAAVFALLASQWRSPGMAYVTTGLGTIAVGQFALALDGSLQELAIALAALGFSYSLLSTLAFLWRSNRPLPRRLAILIDFWVEPMERTALGLSVGSLVLAGLLGVDLVYWLVLAIQGANFRGLVDPTTVRMVVGVLGFVGLQYLVVALARGRRRLGYVAAGMVLAAWILHAYMARVLVGLGQLQWYVVPVGLVLLGIAYVEWQRGNKAMSRRLDYVAIVLMFGSLFWQTMLFGWAYALLLGAEGLAAFFWGSGRRLRRFLYAGMVGVILATTGQLLNSLRSVNQWIVFGIIGLLLVMAAIVVERKLEDIKAWREVLDTWE
jgi:hypothetical protein